MEGPQEGDSNSQQDNQPVDTQHSAPHDPLVEHQLKHCSSILAKLKRSSNARPFLYPVDAEALGIADYYEKIKNPMDFSTIKHKLDSREYTSPEEFREDVLLVFTNCYTYNPPENMVYIMGNNLQKTFEKFYENLPKGISSPRTTPAAATRKPKRVAKASEAMMSAEDQSFCTSVINELEKNKHKKYTWPFVEPVTEQEAPGYFEIVKNPIDITTIRNKFENKKYISAKEFTADLELLIQNCFLYNPPGSDVYACGKELDKVVSSLTSWKKGQNVELNEMRRTLDELIKELKELERKKAENDNVYSLSERERIGNVLMGMSKYQMEKIAEIVYKNNAYESIGNDELTINLHTMADEVVHKMSMYIQKFKQNDDDDVSQSSSIIV